VLKTLYIKNYAIVDELTIDFCSGLNVLTGETGAGKSILVGALSLLLGERAQTEMVRTGSDAAIVEGTFILPAGDRRADLWRTLDIAGKPPADGGEVRIRREVYRKGTSRCFVGDGLVSLSNLKVFGDRMGDLCGQHQHQSLLHPRAHVRFLDERAGLRTRATAFRVAFDQLKVDQKRWDDLIGRAEEHRRAYELAKFQVAEIRAAGLTPTEEDDLKRELDVLKNARRLIEAGERAQSLLSEDAESAADRIAAVRKEFQSLTKVDERLVPTVELLEKCEAQVADVAAALAEYCRRVDFNPARAEEIEARLKEIFQLKQKYGSSCAAILDRLTLLDNEVGQYCERDDQKEKFARQLEKQKSKLAGEAQTLSRLRQRAAKKLATEIDTTLAELGMKGAKWRVRFDPVSSGPIAVPISGQDVPLADNGLEEIEFEIETNPGEGFKPLVKIASGGELSRVMLALKAVGKAGADVSFLVFDEVDSGIGGRVAYAVGKQLKKLAQHYQVFLISHLPQMASLADHHFKVTKKRIGGRVATQIRLLNQEERVEEVARMMASEEITEATRKHAAEIIKPPTGKRARTGK